MRLPKQKSEMGESANLCPFQKTPTEKKGNRVRIPKSGSAIVFLQMPLECAFILLIIAIEKGATACRCCANFENSVKNCSRERHSLLFLFQLNISRELKE